MTKKLFRFAAVVCFLLSASQVCAFFTVLDVPETVSIREKILQTWLTAPLSAITAKKPEIHYNETGQIFQVRTEDFGSQLAIVVSPRQRDYSFPMTAAGSWVLFRDAKTGAQKSIRFYFQSDKEVFVQFRPGEPKNLIDFIVFGSYAVRNSPIALSYESLYLVSFAEVVRITAPILPWKYVSLDPRLYYYSLFMIAVIRENLPYFEYVDDAAYDEYGKPIFIKTEAPRNQTEGKIGVNCSGFVKWIIDGLIEPITGGYTKVTPLKESTAAFLNMWDQAAEKNDAYFGLNWCRNLAAAAISSGTGFGNKLPANEADVTDNYFSAFETEKGIQRSEGYVKDAGYTTELLKSLLYVSAALYPDRFYLAAVRTGDLAKPETVQFSHTAALFPYFDSAMQFRIAVFESGKETDFAEFVSRNAGTFVHLSKVKSSDRFFPLKK